MKRIVYLLIPVIVVALVIFVKMVLGIDDNLSIFIGMMLITGGLIFLTIDRFELSQKRMTVDARLSMLEDKLVELKTLIAIYREDR